PSEIGFENPNVHRPMPIHMYSFCHVRTQQGRRQRPSVGVSIAELLGRRLGGPIQSTPGLGFLPKRQRADIAYVRSAMGVLEESFMNLEHGSDAQPSADKRYEYF